MLVSFSTVSKGSGLRNELRTTDWRSKIHSGQYMSEGISLAMLQSVAGARTRISETLKTSPWSSRLFVVTTICA